MKKVLVLGSLNMDLVTKVKRTPKIGETLLGSGFNEIPGGKGANQAVALGRLGGNVAMIGMVGKDGYGDSLLENLSINHVNSDYIKKSTNSSTGLALIMVNENGDNSIVVIPGANFDLLPEDIITDYFKDVDYLLAQLETPIETIEKAFIIAKENNIMTILNPAPARELSPRLIANIDLIIPNETEFEELTGIIPDSEDKIHEGAKIMFSQGTKAILLTLGKNGAYYIDNTFKVYSTNSYHVDSVDTTAAGDSFIGGLLTKLSQGESIEDSIEFAMKVGAITVSSHGAQSSLPTAEDISKFKGEKRQ